MLFYIRVQLNVFVERVSEEREAFMEGWFVGAVLSLKEKSGLVVR